MGMFDSIHIKSGLVCPKCGTKLIDEEFQTKDLDNCLNHYQFPDTLELRNYNLESPEMNLTIGIHALCPNKKCDILMGGIAKIKFGLIYEIVLPGYNSKTKQKISVKPSKELASLIIENKKLKSNNQELKDGISTLLFAIYNGDDLSPEKLQKFEDHFKINILKEFKEHFGKSPEEIFNNPSFSHVIWKLNKFYEMIHKK